MQGGNMHEMMRMMMGQMREPRDPNAPDPNLQFYMGETECKPNGYLIDDLLEKRKGDFEFLEYEHGYIQWIFPVFENAGMNFESEALSKEAAKAIRENEIASRRVITSYRVMLHFYGFQLADERTGKVERDPETFERGIANLNESSHNWLRISRIITSLGELGFRRYKRPFLDALKAEVDTGKLAMARGSLQNFWTPLVEAEDSEGYARKTLETADDRAEGCLFVPGGALAE